MGFWDELRGAALDIGADLGRRAQAGVSAFSQAGVMPDDVFASDNGYPGSEYPPDISKAAPELIDQGKTPEAPVKDPEYLGWDPFAIVEQLGYREKPTAVTYGTLDSMFWRLPILAAIRKTRVDQVAAFSQPQRPPHEPGFRVRMRDMHRTPTRAEKKRTRELENLMLTTGVTDDPRSRESFETFCRKITHDSMTFDQACYEITPDRMGRPAAWYAVDASTIRLADTAALRPSTDVNSVFAVQVYDNVIINEYTKREMAFSIRNPRSSIRTHNYGTSEAEMMISTITYLLWGMQYNGNQFSQGTVAKGLLNLKGSIPERQLRAFRRQWYQMVSGVENAFRTPILNAENVEWIDLYKSNREMEYSAWIDFLIKIACAIFAMDPIEVNFKYGGSGQKAMFEAANKVKIVESKAKGLAPLLRFLERSINENILWPIDPNFCLEFTGLSPMTPKELADLETMKVRTYMMVDEIRAQHDLPALPHGLGRVINDPNWMQARRDVMLQQQASAAAAEYQEERDAASEDQTEDARRVAEAAAEAAGRPTGSVDMTTGKSVMGAAVSSAPAHDSEPLGGVLLVDEEF
jgi:hypothetical protein